jgi:DNA-binding transcriptional LysR family regulator
MIEHLRSMAVFTEVVDKGSFRGAAASLGLSPSVVSHHVAELERQLGVTLLYRTTRRLALSPDGHRLVAACREMLSAARRGLDAVSAVSETPSGTLRITAPAMLAGTPFVEDLADFARAFPKVALNISFDDRPTNLVADGFDLAIRIGWLEDSGLKARKLMTLAVRLCASPDYVAERKRITTPDDLTDMDWIAMTMLEKHLDFIGPNNQHRRIDCRSRIRVDSATAAKGLALAGMGLAALLELDVAQALAENHLVHVLPDWELPSPSVYAIWPANATPSALSRRFVAFLAEDALPRRREALSAGRSQIDSNGKA